MDSFYGSGAVASGFFEPGFGEIVKLMKVQIRLREEDVLLAKRLAKASGRYYHELLREAVARGLRARSVIQ